MSCVSLVLCIFFGVEPSITIASAYDGGGRSLYSSNGSGGAEGSGADGAWPSVVSDLTLLGFENVDLKGTEPIVIGTLREIKGRFPAPFAYTLNSNLYVHSIMWQ